VVGRGFYAYFQFVPGAIHLLAITPGFQPGLGKLRNLKPLKEDMLDIKDIDKLVEPCYEQCFPVRLGQFYITMEDLSHLIEVNYDAEHASGGIGESLLETGAVSHDANVRRMLDKFKVFLHLH